jgi:hypothetical protein
MNPPTFQLGLDKMMRVDHLDSRDAAESKERRETLLERRARVLGHRSLRYVENTKSQTGK